MHHERFRDHGPTLVRRYRMIPPDLVERDEFAPFWRLPRVHEVPVRVRTP